MDLLQELKKNPFVLAPMAGITHCVFRELMRQQGAGIVVSELVSANGLKHDSEKTKKLLQFSTQERPVGLQIFGEDEENLIFAAQYVERLGADFVDINLGCPVPKVVKKGGGAALLKDPIGLRRICRKIRENIKIPLTLKIRTGWDQNTRNALEICQMAFDEGVTWVAIHGRTRSQGYKGKADWQYIAEIKAKSYLPIIGNGDITSASIACRRLSESGCDGVMIGRGCLKNPWIFQQAKEMWSGKKTNHLEKNYLFLFHYLRDRGSLFYDDRHLGLQLRKLASWYCAGQPRSGEFRRRIFTVRGLEETFESITQYYEKLSIESQKNTSHENFLMGGHG